MRNLKSRALAMVLFALSVFTGVSGAVSIHADEESVQTASESAAEELPEVSETPGYVTVTAEGASGSVSIKSDAEERTVRRDKEGSPDEVTLEAAVGSIIAVSAAADEGYEVASFEITSEDKVIEMASLHEPDVTSDIPVTDTPVSVQIRFAKTEETAEEEKAVKEEPEEETEEGPEQEKEEPEEDPAEEMEDVKTEAEETMGAAEQEEETAIVRSGVTAGLSWVERANGDIVMEDGTVYTPVYPSAETVARREAEVSGEPALRRMASPMLKAASSLRLAAERPSEVPESFSGSAVVNWRDNGSESANFGLGSFSGIPEGVTGEIGTVYTHCADPTAAAPYEGMVCSYTATLKEWDGETGTATYSLYATPPGATDGHSSNQYGLIGYQHLAGDMALQFAVNGNITVKKTVSDPRTPIGNGFYSYEGVTFGLYADSACTEEVELLSCDAATGLTDSVSVTQGTYYLKEKTAGKGLELNGDVITVEIASGEEKEIEVSDAPVLTKLNIQKVSAMPAMTEKNPCYSFAGAAYSVYASQADADAGSGAVASVTTDASGYGESDASLFVGETYYVKETKAPDGGSYQIDPAVHAVTTKELSAVTEDTAAKLAEMPANDPAAIGIEKAASTGVASAEGKSLAGTQFTIRYYKGEYTSLSSLPAPDKTWVLQVKKQGDGKYRTFLLPDYKISGDDFYLLPGNPDPVLPLGTVTIEETKAADGYRLENTYTNGSIQGTGVFLGVIKKNGDAVQLTYQNTAIAEAGFTASDTPIYGGVKIRKMDADRKEARPQGDAVLQDAAFEIVSNNDYTVSVKGKEYKKNDVVMTIRTDEAGLASTGKSDLQYGSYTIREAEGGAPAGYRHKGTLSRNFSITEDGVIVDLTDAAGSILNEVVRGGVAVEKQDAELKKNEAMGGASLAGIRFSVENAGRESVLVDGTWYETGEEILTLTTDAFGHAETEADLLPYGTYTVRELPADDEGTAASDSYLFTDTEAKTFAVRDEGVLVTTDTAGETLAFRDRVKRNDLSFRKVEDGTDRPMGYIPFVIESVDTGERHVVVTDANGMYSSAKYAHSRNTNANDGVLDAYTDDTVLAAEMLDYKSGTWFGMGKEGSAAAADDSLPAFPYGTYRITELRCEANEGYELIINYPFVIEEDTSETGGEKLSLNSLHNIPVLPEIRTMAMGDKTGDHVLPAEEEAGITDIVSATNLQKGAHYILTATLMDEETENAVRIGDADGNRIKITGERPFTATEESMEIEVPIILDTRALAGKTIVVFEQLCQIEEDGTRVPVADHKEITDKDQSLTIPEVRTSFSDTVSGSQIGTVSEEQIVSDTVYYSGLTPGKEVTIQAMVMTTDEAGNAVALTDKNGEIQSKVMTFTPEKSEGSVKIEFTIDSTLLAGKKAVCFEEVRYGKIPVAIHADIHDEDQTLWYPGIRTTAVDKATGDHVASVSGSGVFADTVSYSGLKPGVSYTAKAVLMDAETGEPVLSGNREITAEKTFVPDRDSGTIAVEIPVDTEAIAGRKTVVFEELYMKETGTGGEETLVAEHKDLEDLDQQVSVPKIKTTLTDEETGSHTAAYGEKVRLMDTVTYTGLVLGKEYHLEAVLMTADENGEETEVTDADGNPYTAEKTFTAEEEDGTETVSFMVDAALLSGKKAVCFETLYMEEVQLAIHADIEDEDQTVVFPSIRTSAKDAVTGVHLASEGNTVFTDTVTYQNLTPGSAYVMRGTLMDAETGKAVSAGFLKKVAGETEFTPDTSDGSTEVSFHVDTAKLAGVTTVVFEELYLKSDSGKEIPAAVHKDLSDTDQQVRIADVRTSASVKGEKECVAGEDTELIDTVSFSNLVPGETYVLKGKLIDKASGQPISVNGRAITAEKTFTASSGRGSEEVEFHFDSTLLEGKTVVVFEDLYLTNSEGKKVKIASHADANDAEQSVKIGIPEKPAVLTPTPASRVPLKAVSVTAPKTGDTSRIWLYAVIFGGAAAAGAGLLIIRKKRNL